MMWSKLQKQLYLIIDKDSGFQIHCSVLKTKSAWVAGLDKHGISKARESIPRFWITVGKDKKIIWDYPKDYAEDIKYSYFHWDNYTWVAETIRYYLNTPKEKLLTDTYERDKYGLTDILRKYDRRISKNIREELGNGYL